MEGEKITGSCSSENELNDCSGDGISLSQNGRGNMLLDYSADRVVLEERCGGAILHPVDGENGRQFAQLGVLPSQPRQGGVVLNKDCVGGEMLHSVIGDSDRQDSQQAAQSAQCRQGDRGKYPAFLED